MKEGAFRDDGSTFMLSPSFESVIQTVVVAVHVSSARQVEV